MQTFDQHHNTQFIGWITHLTAAISSIKLYADDHPQVKKHINKAYRSISEALESIPELTFILIGDKVVVNNSPLKDNSPHIFQFCRLLKTKGIERLSFVAGLRLEEFENFIQSITSPEAKFIQGQSTIRLGKVSLFSSNEMHQVLPENNILAQLKNDDLLETLQKLQKLPLENVQEIYDGIRRRKAMNVAGIDGIVKSFIRGFSYGLRPLQMLAKLKGVDQYTFTHVVNVCLLTMAQAQAVGVSGKQLYDVGIAAVLHDVGKLFVPDDILNKPGKLTKEERAVIEKHTIFGARYILKLSDVPQLAIIGALEHHIRYDGSGYPFISSNFRPHLISQMIAIADIYDAMRSRRPYQAPRPEEFIISILKREKGTSFNPLLVENFLRLLLYDHQLIHDQKN